MSGVADLDKVICRLLVVLESQGVITGQMADMIHTGEAKGSQEDLKNQTDGVRSGELRVQGSLFRGKPQACEDMILADVVLEGVEVPAYRVEVMRALRKIVGCSTYRAQTLVEECPVVVLSQIALDAAREHAAALREAGAKVRITYEGEGERPTPKVHAVRHIAEALKTGGVTSEGSQRLAEYVWETCARVIHDSYEEHVRESTS